MKIRVFDAGVEMTDARVFKRGWPSDKMNIIMGKRERPNICVESDP